MHYITLCMYNNTIIKFKFLFKPRNTMFLLSNWNHWVVMCIMTGKVVLISYNWIWNTMILLPSHRQGQSKACFLGVYALGDTFSVVTPSLYVHPVHPVHPVLLLPPCPPTSIPSSYVHPVLPRSLHDTHVLQVLPDILALFRFCISLSTQTKEQRTG